ncbi:MAG: CRISPR-associated endonuclease Cas1, partial [Thermoplasmatales archaeon]|nr:CRISPR-associated endonuclease Cas1 [Thermoplasmatales archaeon]
METYYITSSGRLEKDGDSLKFSNSEGTDTIPLEAVSNIIVSGNVTITKAAVSLISSKNVPLFYMSFYGNYISSLLPEDFLISGTVIRKQVTASVDMGTRLVIAKSFIIGAARNMNLVARRAGMGKLDIRKKSIEEAQNIKSLMGVEGNIRSEYFELMDRVLPEPFKIGKRVRRPPNNRSNSLISFLNSILYA